MRFIIKKKKYIQNCCTKNRNKEKRKKWKIKKKEKVK